MNMQMKSTDFFNRKRFMLLTVSFMLSVAFIQAQTQILWGYGDNFSGYANSGLGKQSDLKILSHWYNGPQDSWIWGYSGTNTISSYYAQGYGIQLIVWLGPGAFGSGANSSMNYAAGDVVSLQSGKECWFPEDLRHLIEVFKGDGPVYGPLYVVLFSEVETYYNSNDNAYKNKLQQAYLDAIESIHEIYPYASVGLGFGGYGWPVNSIGNRDLSFWSPSIAASDFVCTQSMQQYDHWTENTFQIRSAVKQLGQYGKPVMISHFKIWGNPNSEPMGPRQTKPAFENFMDNMFTEQSLSDLYDDGLRMFVFMDDEYVRDRNGRNYSDTIIKDVHYNAIEHYNDAAFNTARDFVNAHNQTNPVMLLNSSPAPDRATRQLLLNYSFDGDRNFAPDIHSSSNFTASDLTFPASNVSFVIHSDDTDPHGTGNGKWIHDTGYQTQNINAPSLKDAVDATNVNKRNDYLAFTVTPNEEQSLALSWLSFDMQMRNGANLSNPPVLDFCAALFYKKGDYMFRIGDTFKVSAEQSGATSGWITCPVDFSNVAFEAGKAVEFRIYCWRESESISGLHSRWLEIDNIRLYGLSTASGMHPSAYDDDCQIYPNPAKEVIHIDGINDFEVSILDCTGRVVIRKNYVTNNHVVNVSDLNQGIYAAQITKNGKSFIRKFVKK
jgi:hypothetical protein